MEGKAQVLYDFGGADDQELTVFAGQQVSKTSKMSYICSEEAWLQLLYESFVAACTFRGACRQVPQCGG